MNENKRPRLRLIRGGASSTDSGDHANPHGIPRPSHLLSPAGSPRPHTSPDHPSLGIPPLNVSGEGPYIEPDPTPPHGIERPKRLRVIKGGKE